MAMKGKSFVAKTGADGVTWYDIDELNEASMNVAGENIDITKFGDDFVNRIQGIKDCTYSISGFYDPADTNGQLAMWTAFLADTDIWIAFLSDGSAGFEQEVKVSSFEISTSVDGAVEVSIELEGTGAIAAYG